jgi:Xaa-Pro dipeptidase
LLDLLLQVHHRSLSRGPRAQQVHQQGRPGQVLGCWWSPVSSGGHRHAIDNQFANLIAVNSIEDNILVTETGHENLTDVPRELDEMEALVSAA